MRYEKNIVKKPWGYEYLAYENDECALWFLYIKEGEKTSMHCHPKKTTGLVVLDGEAIVSFLNNKNYLGSLNKIMIRKGLFHSTHAPLSPGVSLFEVETPVDKHDLVRLKDSYGREGSPYEDSSHDIPKKEECLWIEDPQKGEERIYNIHNCTLKVKNILSYKELQIDDDINVMFLRGGLVTEYGINVAGAGDIVSSNVLHQLTDVFTSLKENTIIMLMERND